MSRQSADIVFVLDASQSMEPCINAVKNNIVDFTKVFQDDPNNMWDIRLDFLAHKDNTLENRSNESGIDKDFKKRVVAAGGQYEGVDFRVSLKWHNTDDVDLHVQTPFGETIYFSEKKSTCSGELDVDRNVSGETTEPVENIRWKTGDANNGKYKIWVKLYNRHGSDRDTPFKVEIYNNGRTEYFEDTFVKEDPEKKEIQVGTFTFNKSDAPTPIQEGGFESSSTRCSNVLSAVYSNNGQDLFTTDIPAFQNALSQVDVSGNESSVVALDIAIDFPWRDQRTCRRIIILFTDEPVAGGNRAQQSFDLCDELIDKMMEQGILLFMVTPECETFETLSQVDKSIWDPFTDSDSFQNIPFRELLLDMAKSITKSKLQVVPENIPDRRARFGQDNW